MDATRTRRTRDRARQAWYAHCRQKRFARFLGFTSESPVKSVATCTRWHAQFAEDQPIREPAEFAMTDDIPLVTLCADAACATITRV
jgi:hypothetical protein